MLYDMYVYVYIVQLECLRERHRALGRAERVAGQPGRRAVCRYMSYSIVYYFAIRYGIA